MYPLLILSLPYGCKIRKNLFPATHLVVANNIKSIEDKQGIYLNHLVGSLIHVTVQTIYDMNYMLMCLSGYMNILSVPVFRSLRHSM